MTPSIATIPWCRFCTLPSAGALIDGEGEETLAQKRAGRGSGLADEHDIQPFPVHLGIAAQLARVGAVGEKQPYGTVALGLHAERPPELEGGGQRRGQGEGLADHRRHRGVMVVPDQQRVGQRTQTHEPTADRAAGEEEGRDAARHDQIGHRRAPAVQESGSV